MMWLLSALAIGFLGSFHCAGMCGPIALALPKQDGSAVSYLTGRLLYNGGRVMTYSILGLLAGTLGHTIAMAGFQKIFSITAGILVLGMALLPFIRLKTGSMSGLLARYTAGIKALFRKLFGLKSLTTLFLIGTVNGLLPCGFVYLALAGAATAGTGLDGFGYMLLFGLGTVPMMLSLTLAGKFFSPGTQKFIRRLSPVVAVSVAILLIMRGILVEPHTCCSHH